MRIIVKLLFLLFGLLNFNSYAQYQVNHLRTDGETMTFRIVGYGKNAQKASVDAETGVLKAIIFHGIPNSQLSTPMVSEQENTASSNNKEFWNSFWGGNYKNMITRSVIVRKFAKDENKQKSITLEVTVNTRALRCELENNGIIRKFGL